MAGQFWAVAEASAAKRELSSGSPAVGYAAAITTWIISGSNYVAVKLSASEIPPWTMCFFRSLIAAVVLIPLVTNYRREVIDFLRRHWRDAAVIGAIGFGLTQGAMYTAIHYTSVVNAGIVFALGPIIMMVMARFVLNEDLNVWQVIGSIIAFCGIMFVSVDGSLSRLLGLQIGFGELLAMVSAILFAAYGILLKRARFTLPSIPLIVILFLAGCLATLPFSLFEIWNGEHEDLDTTGLMALLYSGIVAGALLFLLYNKSLDILGVGRAGLFIYSQMIFVAFFGWLILGEAIEWYHYVGTSLIIGGITLATLLRPKPAAHAANS